MGDNAATRWRAGTSGNPGGRTKASVEVAKLVRAATKDGAELVDLVLAIARGTHETIKSERSRTWALEWLADRAFGRPVQSIELQMPEAARPLNFAVLSDAELEAIEVIYAKLEGRDPQSAPLALAGRRRPIEDAGNRPEALEIEG
jgi:hypothetical protein